MLRFVLAAPILLLSASSLQQRESQALATRASAAAKLPQRSSWAVPGRTDAVTSISLRKEPMPLECNLENAIGCPTPTRHQRLRPGTVHVTKRDWFARLTNDLNAIPPWQKQYQNGCNLGADGWLFHVIFHYDEGDQWTVTVDVGHGAEMVFPNNGDPDRGAGPRCVTPRTAAKLNKDLAAAFASGH